MWYFHMAALMFFTSHGIKARTHAHTEITHFPMRCTIRTWEALGCRLSAFQVLMVHRVGKCVISTWAWVLAFIPWHVKHQGSYVGITHFHTLFFCMKWVLGLGVWDEAAEGIRSLKTTGQAGPPVSSSVCRLRHTGSSVYQYITCDIGTLFLSASYESVRNTTICFNNLPVRYFCLFFILFSWLDAACAW